MIGLRTTSRGLARSPGFSIAVVAVLAVGIGASTAVFSVLQGVVFRPLPLPQSDRLVMVRQTQIGGDGEDILVNPLNARDLEEAAAFTAVAGGTRWGPTLEGVDGRPAERLNGAQIDWDMFQVLGRDPQLGRLFLPEDQTMEAAQVVVISHQLWQRRFEGDPEVLGEIDRRARILVADRGFFDALGMEAASGRLLQESDDADAPPPGAGGEDGRSWASSRTFDTGDRGSPPHLPCTSPSSSGRSPS